MSLSNPSGKPPPSVFTPEQMTSILIKLKSMLIWVIVLLVMNLILSAYVADFVHTILSDIHSL